MHCPVCGEEVNARFTKSGRTYRKGLMVVCPDDSRHFRGFVNDPQFLRHADRFDDPKLLLATKGQR